MVDFSTPASAESRVEARKKVYDDYLDLDPALKAQQRREKEAAKTAAMRGTFQAVTQQPGVEGKLAASGVTKGAQQQMAGTLPSHAAAIDALAAKGAGMQQGIAGAESEQRLANVGMSMQKGTADYARRLAQQAFQQGLDAKRAIFHTNAAFSDTAFEQLANDYEQGRVAKSELQGLLASTKQRLTERQGTAEVALRDAMLKFKSGLTSENFAERKSNLLYAMELQKNALEDAARAQQLAAIISGGLKVGAMAAGGV